MRKTLLLFVFLFSVFVINAQSITHSPDPTNLEGLESETDIHSDLVITQTLSDQLDVYWSIDRGDTPSEWEFWVCDQNLCYSSNSAHSSPNKPNTMLKNNANIWSVHCNPNNVTGNDTIFINLYDENTFTNLIATIPVYISSGVQGTKGLETAISESLQLFPNPTTDYFNVLLDNEVDQIAIYNIVGKKMKQEKHIIGQGHDITDLQRGLYLVRLLDTRGDMLKVIRMTKK